MTLSPLNQRRLQNFRANRRGWWSLWIFVLASFFVLVVRILWDVFSDDSLGGWGKFFWTVFIILTTVGSSSYGARTDPPEGGGTTLAQYVRNR